MAKQVVNRSFARRRARLTKCCNCGVSLFVGIGEGIPYKIDPVPITVQGELMARMQGRLTLGMDYGYHFYYRDELRMRLKPRPAVVTEHKCGLVLFDHVDIEWIPTFTRIVDELTKRPEEDESEEEMEALYTLHSELGAKVLDDAVIPF